MKPMFIWVLSTLLLTACGGDSVENQPTAASSEVKNSQSNGQAAGDSSKLKQFMNAESICDVLSTTEVQQLFQTATTIETSGLNHRSRYTCSYTWDKQDKAAKEKLMMDNIMQSAQGKAERLPMRLTMPTNQITVTLSETKKSAANFMPPKLTDEQLAERIKMAKEAANKRLTNEQKELAGDMANSMVEKMLTQNNQNQKIDGIGDAAYWTAVSTGGLNILVDGVEIHIGPLVAETAAEDMINAKNIAGLLLK